MAGHGEINGDKQAMDTSAHRASYERFLGWAKFATIVSFIVAAIAVVLIAR